MKLGTVCCQKLYGSRICVSTKRCGGSWRAIYVVRRRGMSIRRTEGSLVQGDGRGSQHTKAEARWGNQAEIFRAVEEGEDLLYGTRNSLLAKEGIHVMSSRSVSSGMTNGL